MNSQELAYEVARIIDDKRGHDILIIDLRGIADIADFFVIGTGDNNRQVDAIVDEVENQLRPKDVRAVAIGGREDNSWDIMDFGSVIAHVFQPEARAFYRLEKLWADAPRAEYVDGVVTELGHGSSDRQNAESEDADADSLNSAKELGEN